MERTDNNQKCMEERNNLISYFEDKYQSEHKKYQREKVMS
jgi:hypothetical protein